MALLKSLKFSMITQNNRRIKVYDITCTTSPDMPVYPGDPKPEFQMHLKIEKEGVNVTRIIFGSHTGTHVDAPWHFFPRGSTIDKEPLDKFIGQAVIVDVSYKEIGSSINSPDLDRYANTIGPDDIVLIYTGTSDLLLDHDERATRNFTYLERSAAEWLVQHHIKSIGIDTLSIEKFGSKEAPVHKILLGSGIGIIENLNSNLKQFAGKRMFLACLPLLLEGIDGSPARAVLLDMQ